MLNHRAALLLTQLLCIVFPAYADQGKPATPLETLTITGEKCQIGKECARNPSTPHTGVDFKAIAGTPVYAICDGKVKLDASNREDINSRFLIIEHSNCGGISKLYGYYGHIDSIIGGVGSQVRRGQQIATVKNWPGNTHLHFGVSPKFFSYGWGYQSGDPIQNGWLDPLKFLNQAHSLDVTKQPTITNNAVAQQKPTSNQKQSDGKGAYEWRAEVDRKQLDPQQVCESWVRKDFSRDRTILYVRHVTRRNETASRIEHLCQFQYRLKPPGSFIHGFSLGDYTKPRTEMLLGLDNALFSTCSRAYGLGYALKQGKLGTQDELKVYCEKTVGWRRVYK